MAGANDRSLGQAFRAYAGGGARMDGRAFVKCLKEAGLLDGGKVRPAEADLIFAKCRPRDNRKIDLMLFRQALGLVAQKLGMEEQQVLASVRSAGGPRPSSPEPKAKNAGMSISKRLFYDRSTYTGTHKHGGPTLLGGGMFEHDMISDKELVNRSLVMRHKSAPPTHLSDEEPPSLPQSPNQKERSVSKETSTDRSTSKEVIHGPERFFYDKSTYTGTHRHGGPDVLGNGMKKKGYSDLSEVVDRDIVLDDALHRRLRSKSRESTPDGRRLPTLLGQRVGAEVRTAGRGSPERRKEADAGLVAELGPSSRAAHLINTSFDGDAKGEVPANGSPSSIARSSSLHVEVKVEVPLLQQTPGRRPDQVSTPATPQTGANASMPSSSRLNSNALQIQAAPTPPIGGISSAPVQGLQGTLSAMSSARQHAQHHMEPASGYPSAGGYPAAAPRPLVQGPVAGAQHPAGAPRVLGGGSAVQRAGTPQMGGAPARTPVAMAPAPMMAGRPMGAAVPGMAPYMCLAR